MILKHAKYCLSTPLTQQPHNNHTWFTHQPHMVHTTLTHESHMNHIKDDIENLRHSQSGWLMHAQSEIYNYNILYLINSSSVHEKCSED